MDTEPPVHDLLNPDGEPVLRSPRAQIEEASVSLRLHDKEAIVPYYSGWESLAKTSVGFSTTTGKKRRLDSHDEAEDEISPAKRRDLLQARQTGETDSDDYEVLVPGLPEPEFPQFSKLPIEVRLKIWRFMIPGRRIVIVDFFHKKDSDNWGQDNNLLVTLDDDSWQARDGVLLGTRSATPIIFSICRESRIEAQRIFYKGFSRRDHPLRPFRWQPEKDILYFIDDELRDRKLENEHLHDRPVFGNLYDSISNPALQNLRYLAIDLKECNLDQIEWQMGYLDRAAKGIDEGVDLNYSFVYFIHKFSALETLYIILDPFGHALQEGEPSFLDIEDVQRFEYLGIASDDFEGRINFSSYVKLFAPDWTPPVVKIKVLKRSKDLRVPFCFGRRWCKDHREFLSPKKVKHSDLNENGNQIVGKAMRHLHELPDSNDGF